MERGKVHDRLAFVVLAEAPSVTAASGVGLPTVDALCPGRLLVGREVVSVVGGSLPAVDLSVEEFEAQLTDVDPGVRRKVWGVLGGISRDDVRLECVHAVLRVLADEARSYAWPDCIEVLRTAPYAWGVRDALVNALASAPTDGLAGRVAGAIGLPAGTWPPRFSAEQVPDSVVTCRCIGSDPAASGDGVPSAREVPACQCSQVLVLVALLASRIESVRRQAMEDLVDLGPGVAGILRAVRRSRTPARRAALQTLVELDWRELDASGRAAIERLIRIKQLNEVPQPTGYLEGAWYALPTTDQAAVLDAFGLCDPVPVTMRMGFAPWNFEEDREFTYRFADLDDRAENEPGGLWRQVFVTPVLDGWTLVFADNGLFDASDDDAYRRCAQLSRRFGAAHWYAESGESGCGDFSVWCVAEGGEILRHCRYSHYDGLQIGPVQHPAAGQSLSLEELRAWVGEHDHGTGHPPTPWPGPKEWEFEVSEVAWRLSVSPETLGPHTQVQGVGVLAVPASLRHKRRYGTPPI